MRNKSSFCKLLYLRFIKTVLDRSEPPTHSRGKLCLGGVSGRRREQTHHSQKGRAIWTTPRRTASPWVDVFVVSRCRCWWANAGAGTRGDAGWSLSPERRCYGLWLFFSDLLFSSIFYTCDLSKDGRMNSPHSSETC